MLILRNIDLIHEINLEEACENQEFRKKTGRLCSILSLSEFHLNINFSKTKPFQEPIPSDPTFPKFFLYFQKLSYIHSCLPTNLKVTP